LPPSYPPSRAPRGCTTAADAAPAPRPSAAEGTLASDEALAALREKLTGN
jgi:small subunit ribosomal protein S1